MWFNEKGRRHSEKKPDEEVVTPSNFKMPKVPEAPGIYQLVKIGNNLDVVYESNIIKTEELIFGETAKRVIREWTRFCNYDESVGSLNLGDMGSGKTNKCDLLANLAVLKGNLPVIKITGLTVEENELQFFQNINNCCLYFDEFSKHVSYHIQQKMLSLLTNTNKKFLILYTDNEKNGINRYILDRMQRARYREEFGKLSKQTVLDVMSLFDVRDSFKEEFLRRYEKALVFSFDNLKGIISEHLDYPDDTLDELLAYLNTSALSKKVKMKLKLVESITKDEDGKEVVKKEDISIVKNPEIDISALKEGFGIEIDHYWFRVSVDNVKSMIGGELILNIKNYRLVYDEEITE